MSDTITNLFHGEGNPRNSEGAFVELKDGRILFAYTRYKGASWADAATADIVGRISTDGGRTWERMTMVELITPTNSAGGFSVPSGVRIRGAFSRGSSYPKHSLRLFFRNEYGMSNYRIAKHFNVGTIEAETEVGGALTSKRDELLTKAVTASVDDFDSVYDGQLEEYMNLGGEEIINERIEKLNEIYGIAFEK